MKSRLALVAVALGIASYTVAAQQPPQTQTPAAPRPPSVLSPEVHADRRVTFRLLAPKASDVSLTGEFMTGSRPLQKDAQGVWSVTLGPFEPERYEYEFSVDGVQILDPRNPVVKYNRGPAQISSIVSVPGDGPLFFDPKPGPHGTIDVRFYDSKATNTVRRVHVYTPPGYEKSNSKLPVLYLLHGADGDDSVWTTFGRAHVILDNLIADRKLAPMVVVMPFGYAYAWDAGKSGEQQQADFLKDLTDNLIPFVQANYRVLADRDHRALAGLSRGGSQTLNIGLRNLDLFSRLAVFSAGGGQNPRDTFKDVAANAATVNQRLKLLWMGCGTEDGVMAGARTFDAFLTDSGIKHTFRATPGEHTWIVWRRYLLEVAPQLWPLASITNLY